MSPTLSALVGRREGAPQAAETVRGRVPIAGCAGGPARSSGEAPVMGVERRGRVIRGCVRPINRTLLREELHGQAEVTRPSRSIFRSGTVWEAYEEVKANQGAPGWTRQSIEEFEKDLKDNLYKIWNRMSSGTLLSAPGAGGGDPETRRRRAPGCLGVPDRGRPDRADGGGPAPGGQGRADLPSRTPTATGRAGPRWTRSESCRERCWKHDWVIEFDIQKFFDSVRWDLIVKAVEAHTDAAVGDAVCEAVACRPAAAARWHPAGAGPRNPAGVGGLSRAGEPVHALRVRCCGWPGSSRPSGSNAMPTMLSCTARDARPRRSWRRCGTGWSEVGLRLHPDKTRIVYCKDGRRRGSYEHTAFTFLGFTFRAARGAVKDGQEVHCRFEPAISKDALKKIGARSAQSGGCTAGPTSP